MAGPGKPGPPRAGRERIERAAIDGKMLEMAARGCTTEEIRKACGFAHRKSVHLRIRKALTELTDESLRRFEIQALQFTQSLLDEGMRLLHPDDGSAPSPQAYTAAVAGHKRLTEFAGLGEAARVRVDVTTDLQSTLQQTVEVDLPELQSLLDRMVVAGIGSGRTPGEQVAALDWTPPVIDAEVVDDDEDEDEGDEGDEGDDGGKDADDDQPELTPTNDLTNSHPEVPDGIPGRWVDDTFIPFWDEADDQ